MKTLTSLFLGTLFLLFGKIAAAQMPPAGVEVDFCHYCSTSSLNDSQTLEILQARFNRGAQQGMEIVVFEDVTRTWTHWRFGWYWYHVGFGEAPPVVGGTGGDPVTGGGGSGPSPWTSGTGGYFRCGTTSSAAGSYQTCVWVSIKIV